MADNWDEKVDSVSPSTAGFSRDGGRAVLPLYFTSFDETSIKTILGFTTPAGNGTLNRTLPIAHPKYWWMNAVNIQTVRGVGKPTKVLSNPLISPEAEVPTYYADYPVYEAVVEFAHLPYPVVKNANIKVTTTTWKDVGDVDVTSKFTTEFIRYTDYDFMPGAKVVTARYGQMVFRAAANPPGNGLRTFTGMPSLTLPQGVLKLRWFWVPTSYLENANSYLLKYLGRINLSDIQLAGRTWTPGQLRYAGLGIRRFLGPVPDSVINTVGKPTNLNARYMDLEFVLEYTMAENASAFSPDPSGTDGNRVQHGHNLFPNYADRKFYYVTVGDKDTPAAGQLPTWNAFPFQLMFTDPEAEAGA